jgi:tetratricopeptide (TPR) repeat protein
VRPAKRPSKSIGFQMVTLAVEAEFSAAIGGRLDIMTGATSRADPGARPERQWDVALSFAGTQREYVEQVAQALRARGVRCFYDADEQIELWGKYLAEELPVIYGEQVAAVVVFVSAEYAARDWTRLERRVALGRAVRERRDYVLPARFDDTPLPGLLSDMVTVDLRTRTPQQFATMIADKLALRTTEPTPPADAESPGRDTEVAHPTVAVPAGKADSRRPGMHPDMSPSPVAVPRQLPTALAGFEGRAAELEALTSLLEETALPGSTVVISAIDGMAGIGKTALAVQWAHQVADRFPDGQLYVNLRGFDPAGTPVMPAEAVRGFLDAFEVPVARIPVSLDAQAALYRSLLAGRRVLVVLDNARDADQVWPLLPGSPGCSVVVTSRNRLTSLIAGGAHPLTVDLLTVTDAYQMLARRVGADRVAAQPQAAQQIIDRCARLPLALSIVAARAAAYPDFPLTALAEELRDAEERLSALDAGEAATSVTAVFSWSYRQLSDPAARLFRLLGLHPGPDISVFAAASLAAVPVPAARLTLAELARAHLLTEHAPGRFAFHDLLRAYATTQTRTRDSGTDRDAARRRMLDHYLHTAQAAWSLSYPHQQQAITVAPLLPGVAPEEPADYLAAWAWFTAEYPVLLALVQLAAATGHHTEAWQLPHMLVPFFERQGHWHDFAATHQTALAAAQRHADQKGQAHAHLGIGRARARIGRFDEARPHLQRALRLFEELGDQAGQSHAHSYLGMTFYTQECYGEALPHLQQAVDLARTGGYRQGLAAALNGLGWVHAQLGNAEQALTYSQQALPLFQDLGDRWGEGAALDTIGYALDHLGHHQQAASYFEQSLAIDRELGDLFSQATDYDHLGDAHHAVGNITQARQAWQQALNILDQLGDVHRMGTGYADPDAIRTKLRHHD